MKTNLIGLLALHLGLAVVVAQPVITNQPQSQTNIVGTTAIFSVGATGTAPLSYQWRSHASGTSYTNIPFGTEATLMLTNVQPTPRRFAVVVTDFGGLSVTSNPLVTLTVFVPPSFTNQPVSQRAEVGDTVTFAAVPTGTTPLAYQWRWNDSNLAGKSATNLVLANVQFTNAGGYTLVVTNAVGAATSQVAVLTVIPAVFTKITNGAIVNDGGFSFSGAWGDYDNDGWVDLFVANAFVVNGNLIENSNANDFLYHNNGDGTFTRITNVVVARDGVWSISGAWGDYDNDGYLDLFVCNPGHPNSLFRNLGDGIFAKVTNGILATESQYSHTGVWSDFDRDGWVDVFIANFQDDPPGGLPDVLFRNQGDGNFAKISFGSKSTNAFHSWNAAWGDFNNDGWPDLFVPHGGTRNRQNSLLHINNGDGSFTTVTNGALSTTIANSVACAWGDYDNDGFLDLFVSNFYGQSNFLWHNNGDSTFTLVTNSAVTSDRGTSVGCAWGDYDNDGWLDLFVANLGPVDSNTVVSIAAENNFLYHNNGDGTFSKVTSGRLVSDLGYSTGCAWADYDNDGFLDLFVANGWITANEKNFLYQNNGNTNNWITLKLVGTISNRSAIGAKVHVKATIDGKTFWQMREISGGSNYGSQNDMRPSFGLGDATNIELIRLEWPSGAVQTMTNIATKQFLTITEPPRLLANMTNGSPQFTLKGGRGFNYQIDTSINLTNWFPLGTVTITNLSGIAPIVDTSPLGDRSRFYRAVSR